MANGGTKLRSVRALVLALLLGLGGIVAVDRADAGAPAVSDTTTAAGTNRYDTAARLARSQWPGPVNHIIVARGTSFPDALAGNALAGALFAPILLTDGARLPSETASAITDLRAPDGSTVVHILGGLGAIDQNVRNQIAALGVNLRETYAGRNRYDTSRIIAGELRFPGTTALITTGTSFADAVAAGPLAYNAVWPVLLVPGNAGPSDPQLAATLRTISDLGITKAIVLGGEGAVSAAVQTALDDALGATNVRRIGGPDRYETAARIADYAISEIGFGVTRVLLARGDSFADALGAGPVAGANGSTIVLTRPTTLSPATESWLVSRAFQYGTIFRVGGDSAVSMATVRAALAAANGRPSGAIRVQAGATDTKFPIGRLSEAAIVEISYFGSGTMKVTAEALDGTELANVYELLGPFRSHRRLVQASYETGAGTTLTSFLNVEATGEWTVAVRSLSTAHTFSTRAVGDRPTILRYTGSSGPARVTHTGGGIVISDHSDTGVFERLTSLGPSPYDRTDLLTPGILDVFAVGPWRIEVT